MKRILVPVIALLTGCNLYFGNHDKGDDTCDVAFPEVETGGIDPNTGQCVNTSPTCQPGCGDCLDGDIATIPPPIGGTCYGSCGTIYDEGTCLATPGCHAEYVNKTEDGTVLFSGFGGCWDIEPMPLLEGGGCEGLDATTCAMHDDCATLLNEDPSGFSYGECIDEGAIPPPDLCGPIDCGGDAHCETQCVPCDDPTNPKCGDDSCYATCVSNSTCETVDCGPGWTCVETCDDTGTCFPVCEEVTPTDPGSCDGELWCDGIPPACPADTTPGIENGCYTGYCIPLADCGPKDPGTCDGAVTCGDKAPECPVDTVPGVKDGCYSGYCIPSASCPAATCDSLTDEGACLARFDCQAIYTGSDCTCLPDGECKCESETFARCETF